MKFLCASEIVEQILPCAPLRSGAASPSMDDKSASDWPAMGTTTVFDIIFASGHDDLGFLEHVLRALRIHEDH